MSLAAQTTLYSGSNTLSVDELNLYHAINDLRVASGLASLKPSYDLTVLAGQHAADFDINVGYDIWAAAPVAARPVPTLHHWSDGQSFVSGVLAIGSGLALTLPQSLAENADGVLAGEQQTNVLADWMANPGASANILSARWDTMGVGIYGDMVYVTFGNYAGATDGTSVVSITGTAGGDTIRGTGWADTIRGLGGNDVFIAPGDGDRLDGGTGLDRLVLSGTADSYSISRVAEDDGTWALITGAEGQIRIQNVEYVQFADGMIDSGSWGEYLTSVRFDADFYARANPDVANAVAIGALDSVETHFWAYGKHEGRDPAAFFDTHYYLAQYPDIAQALEAGALNSAFEHYILFGQFEGRNPNALFNTESYLALNPDVANAVDAGYVGSAIDHYLSFGRYEGRLATDAFDEAFYLAYNPDVAAAVAVGAFDSGLTHYRLLGQLEGREPFDLSGLLPA